MNLLPTLTFQIKVKAHDWAAGGKVELKSLGMKGREDMGEETGEEDDNGGGGRKMELKHVAWRDCKSYGI